ncbi:hypothetical protein CLIB1423_17S03048 [[Candida] railenensis]|uniref:XPG-I domain-containing protein n=1 Tax=[Candida] railenensis TaxID=45579 RepID=A0A9P0QTS6_9ASCO|nr:hypothetical protein CLIB1423_17S03048 [[Candida] railenensis]
MGINDLWAVLSPGFSERVAFPLWVSRFVEEFNRPPRIAIDGFMLLFQSKHSALSEWTDEAIIRMFLAKLVYFSSYNVTYVVVFDGNEKPSKHGENFVGTDMNALDDLGCTPPFNSDILWKLKAALVQYSISFIQCPGEGEAECAMLQKTQVVDYVVSNDVDSLVFGATKMLRNFSRFKDDKPASAAGIDGGAGNFYVTPVHMNLVGERTGLDYARLILIATIRGGDYSSGVDNIGIARAVKIALCGTSFASFYHRSPTKIEAKEIKKGISMIRSDPLPDFSRILLDCFVDPLAPGRVRPANQREARVEKFLELLNWNILERSRDIFERKASNLNNLSIDESFTILYLFPSVSKSKYLFKPDRYNYGDESVNQVIPSDRFDFNIKYLILKLLSHFERVSELKETIRIARSKVIEGSQYVMVKYQAAKIEELIYPSIKMSQNDEILDNQVEAEEEDEGRAKFGAEVLDEAKRANEKSIWIPCSLVNLINPSLLSDYQIDLDKKKEKRISPKKTAPLQKTTLDSLFKRRETSTANSIKFESQEVMTADEGSKSRTENIITDFDFKKEQSLQDGGIINRQDPQKEENSKTESTKAASVARKVSPVRKKRSPRKKILLPGQSLVTSFFSAKQEEQQESKQDILVEEDPFYSKPLFIDSDSDDEIKLRPMTAPSLAYSIPSLKPKRLISSAGSAEVSPSKKQHSLQLSPDNSPEKASKEEIPTVTISPLKRRK